MKKITYLFQFVIYYLGWIGAILLAAQGFKWLGSLLVIILVLLQISWQYKIAKNSQGLLLLIFILTFLGSAFDTLMLRTGLITFAANPFLTYLSPPWMTSLWMSFSVFLFATLSQLFSHFFLISSLSFFGFAIAYSLGVKMGAAFFPHGYATSIIIGASWAVLLPLSLNIYQRILK